MPHLEPSPSSRHERDSIARMLGEFLREAAVLVAVFIPLDRAVRGDRLTVGWGIAIVALPTFLLMLGMGIERTRWQ